MANTPTRLKVPIVGTAQGGQSKYEGYVPVLNQSGVISRTMLPADARSFIQTKSVTIEDPINGENIPLLYTSGTVTFSKFIARTEGISGDSVTWSINYGPDPSLSGTPAVTLGTVTTPTSGTQIVESFDSADVPADNFIWFRTSAIGGAPVRFLITVIYV